MNNKDFDEFTSLLVAVGELYSKPVSPQVIPIWWAALEKYDLAAVREAFSRHAVNPDNGQFMPKPADIVRMIGGTTQDAALMAWAAVDKAVREIGPYQTVVFDDAIIHQCVVDMGGWIRLCEGTEDEWPFKAREFENRYRAYARSGAPATVARKLIGISEAQNMQQGHALPEPVLLGNQKKALDLLKKPEVEQRFAVPLSVVKKLR